MVHDDETHDSVACATLHTFPHVPQLFTSLVRLKPLSITPSQSSSMPLHASRIGFRLRTHDNPPLEQCRVPAAHLPGWPVEQAAPPPGSPSSVDPLQLSSRPLHVSV